MQTQVRRWGNSLAIHIPGAYVRDLNLAEGMELEVSLVAGGLLLRPCGPECTLDELLRNITPENIHGETDWGQAEGRESW
jgi:antitoxin MazE